MPPIIKLSDQDQLVPTEKFPHGKFPFSHFNPMQSRVFEIYDKQANIVISSTTASGKTIAAELAATHELRINHRKVVFLGPMKALVREKYEDWTSKNHHFSDLKICVCTGDYRLTQAKKKELETSDIILLTVEMFNSHVRGHGSDDNQYLKDVGLVIADEIHLLGVQGRGDHEEVGLMKFCEINPNCRIVGLSATVPNASQLADWISYILTGNDTYLVESNYRPIPLGVHYEKYENTRRYELTEEEKVDTAIRIVQDNPEDKYLIFTHTKRTGAMMKKALERAGFPAQFHNADLDREERHKFEDEFKNNPKFQILIATSTMAWGVNTSARRVIVVGVHRGLDEVQPYDIWQMCGRSGRPGYDTRGDCYILLPRDNYNYHYNRIAKDYKITSRLLDYVGTVSDPHYKTLAFHLVSEIHHGNITDKDDVYKWYKRSLAHFQNKDLDDGIIEATLNLLIKCGAIKEIAGKYKCTSVGIVSSMFYYSPFDISDLRSNFQTLFTSGAETNDLATSVALGNVDTVRMGIVSRAEQDEMATFVSRARPTEKIFGKVLQDTAWKGAYCYYQLMNGLPLGVIGGTAHNLQFDFPRLSTVLQMVDTMAGKWHQGKYFGVLEKRIKYGVSSNLVPLCELNNIGKVRAERLWAAGIKTYNDVANNLEKVQAIVKLKRETIEEICNQAKLMAMGVRSITPPTRGGACS